MTNFDVCRLQSCSLGLVLGLVASTVLAQTKPTTSKPMPAKSTAIAVIKTGGPKPPTAKSPAAKPAQTAASQEKEAARPKAGANQAQLKTLVEQTLAKNPYYTPGFLISRRDVESLFARMLSEGITSPDDQEDLGACLLADSSFLAGRLKTPAGREFMKKIMHDPSVYDRLERLSWSPDGRKLIDSLIAAKDDPAQLLQLKTAEQLGKYSKRLAADPQTADFALPTDRAHTAEELVQKLEEVLAAKNAE